MKTMELKPLRNNVLLRVVDANQHRSGLIIASQASNEADVIAVGNDVKELKVGDTVRFDKGSAVPLECSGLSYLMCRELDVLCVVE